MPVKRRDNNGAAWRKVRAHILRTQDVCARCGQPVDKTLHWLDPGAPQVDHIIPISAGGHPTRVANLQLTHRACNRAWGDKKNPGPTRSTRAAPTKVTPVHSREW